MVVEEVASDVVVLAKNKFSDIDVDVDVEVLVCGIVKA